MLTSTSSQPTWLHTQPAGRITGLALASVGSLPISSPIVAIALLG